MGLLQTSLKLDSSAVRIFESNSYFSIWFDSK